MAPGRLGEILDGGGNLAVALDEQDIARLQRAVERFGIGRSVGPVAGGFRLKTVRHPAAEPVEQRIGLFRHPQSSTGRAHSLPASGEDKFSPITFPPNEFHIRVLAI
jgi:hypothetical protein